MIQGGINLKQDTLQLFKTLTELQGASGNEHLVRNFMEEELKQYADEVIYDNLGGVFGVKEGEGPKVMVAGHMDEVGFMVNKITKNGLIHFQPLGGWWYQVFFEQFIQIISEL